MMSKRVSASRPTGSGFRGRWSRRIVGCLALCLLGLTPVVGSSGAVAATPSALTAPSPPNFGPVVLGLFTEETVQVTNTGSSTLSINLNASSNAGNSVDFLVGPANPPDSSCVDAKGNGLPIPAHGVCSMVIFFFPTQFGVRSTIMGFSDSAGGTFQLNVAGTGVGGYFLASASGFWTTFGWSETDLENDGLALNKPIVGTAATPFGMWLVASDGGIFTAGDAQFYGSTGAIALNKPVVGMAATPDGKGYWLVASDGGIFTFGDAQFYGSTGAVALSKPIVGMAASPNGAGYWLVASDGGVFTFNVPFEGSLGGEGFSDIVAIAPTTQPLPDFLFEAQASLRHPIPFWPPHR
jgi:hypothetical protein